MHNIAYKGGTMLYASEVNEFGRYIDEYTGAAYERWLHTYDAGEYVRYTNGPHA